MSQPRGPDSDPHGPGPANGGGEPHPDEALAAYVDGSASPVEVALARTHLAGCPRCREEVELARHAVRAMKELRELDVPWADDEPAIGGSVPRRAAGRPVRSLDEHRLRRRGVIVAAVGLAAAACVAVVLLLVNTGGVPSQEAASSPAFAQGAGAPAVTGADLNALTTRLAGGTRAPSSKASASGVFGAAPATPGGGAPPLPASPTIAPAAVAGVSCARRASGQSDSAVVVYANVAVFQGKRVWVVGFVTTPTSGGTPRLEIVAATTSGCTVVYVGRAPLAATP